MTSDQEFDAKIREIVDTIRNNTKGTDAEKDLAVIRGLIEFNVRGLHELNKRVGKLEKKVP